jgi:hypothetical protein
MANAAGVLLRINQALTKVTPTNKVLYKRVVTITGDSLIGRTTSTSVDTLLVPQPAIQNAGRQHLSGARDAVETIISSDGERDV